MFPLETDELAAAAGAALRRCDARVAVVETTAGGLIAARLVSVPGASGWFERGVVAYSRESKLDLAPDIGPVLDTQGSVSREFVHALAEATRASSGVDYAIAESGIAGPQDGRRSSKAAGTVFIALASATGTLVEACAFTGTRAEIMVQIADRALRMLREALET